MEIDQHHGELTDRDRVRAVREVYEAWNRGDLVAILDDFHPDCEFLVSGSVPGLDSVFRGHQGIRKLFDEWYTGVWQGRLRWSSTGLRPRR